MLAPTAAGPHSYDLCINIAGRRLFWRNRNHGVTLGNDTMAWTMDGAATETAYGNIVAVHLDSAGQKITADRCTISFADNSTLTIVNTDPGGYRDAARTTLYRDFVRDLHTRLGGGRYPQIRFTAGISPVRYWTMLLAAAIAAPAFALAGLAGFVLHHLSNGLLLFVVGEYFCWTLGRRALANRPRDYTPESLPEVLLG